MTETKAEKPRWVPLSKTPEATPVDWLKFGILARGHVANLFGDEGIGKSLYWVLIVADLTKNGIKVAIVVTEDGLEDTVKTRLLAAGADLDNIFVLNVSDELDEFELGIPHPNTELDMMPTDVALVVVDALLDTLNVGVDIAKPPVCRAVFKPWKQFARRRHCAVLTLTHTNRDRSNGTRGALGAAGTIRAVVRLNILAQRDQNDLLAVGLEKTNLCPITNVTLYGHEQVQIFKSTATSDGMVGRLVDRGPGQVTAKELFEQMATPEPKTSRMGDMSQQVLQLVTGIVTPKEIADKINGLDNNAAGQHLRRLAEAGEIKQVSRGKYGPASLPSLHSITSGSEGNDGSDGNQPPIPSVPSLPSLPEMKEKVKECRVCGFGMTFAEDQTNGIHVGCSEKENA